MAEITVAAALDSLDTVLRFVDGQMEQAGCPLKLMTQVDMAVEEIFVNIARYAYHPEAGEASIRCEAGGDPFRIVVGFADRGRPFNPLDRPDPDVTLDAERRQIGGLGILMAKRLMDDIQYEYTLRTTPSPPPASPLQLKHRKTSGRFLLRKRPLAFFAVRTGRPRIRRRQLPQKWDAGRPGVRSAPAYSRLPAWRRSRSGTPGC